MSRVGEHTIREDLYEETRQRTPDSLIISKKESAEHLRADLTGRRARTTTVKSLSEFYDVFRKVILQAENLDGLNYNIRFTEEFPAEDEVFPCYTVRLIDRSPWQDNRGRRELAPRLMETIDDPDQPGNNVEIYYQRQINVVEFNVWARTNRIANNLADWVEEKFFEYLWIFQYAGFGQPIHFLGRGEDKRQTINNMLVHGRPLRFSVVTGRLTRKNMAKLRKVALDLGLRSEDYALNG